MKTGDFALAGKSRLRSQSWPSAAKGLCSLVFPTTGWIVSVALFVSVQRSQQTCSSLSRLQPLASDAEMKTANSTNMNQGYRPRAPQPSKWSKMDEEDDNYFSECTSECDGLIRFFREFHRRSPNVGKTAVCVTFVPRKGFCFKPLHDDDPRNMTSKTEKREGYYGSARELFSIVYKSLPDDVGGSALFVIGDSGNHFDEDFLEALWENKTPFLAHAQKVRETKKFIFIPDYHFIPTRGFQNLIAKMSNNSIPFQDKDASVFWRGSTTGSTKECHQRHATTFPIDPCESLPRVQLARRSLEISGLDAKISNPCQCCEDYVEVLRNDGLIGNHLPQEFWPQYRGIIDIAGNANAWGLFWRLATGSVVLRVMDEKPWTNLYLDKMQPWVHYLPVSSNFSDLEKMVSLATSSDQHVISRLENIARSAKEVTDTLTFDVVVQNVTDSLADLWRS